MRRATYTLVAALLAGGAAAYTQPAYPSKTNATTVSMTNALINTGTVNALLAIPGKMGRGEFVVNAPGQATEKTEVTDVGCLNTVIPPPLNWGPLWCAGKEAKVMQWYDEVGTRHRSIDIPVQANVTANMVLWLFSPLYPQFLEYNDKMWFWYHLWHPLDHIMAANMVSPSTAAIGQVGLYTLIHEHYRNLKTEQGLPEFETDTWFHVEDFMSNFMKKRIVISSNTMGLQAWTLIVNLKDTKAGLKIDVEQVIGAAPVGYDAEDPSRGAPAEAAQIVNDNLVKPTLENFAAGPEFERSMNAITRHVVEEFSMFRFFLPTVWARYPHLHGMFALTDAISSVIPKFNYGPFMKMGALSTKGLTEMMAPLNRTKLHNTTLLKETVAKMPGAITTGLGINLNAQAAGATKALNGVLGAKTVNDAVHGAVRATIPSAAGMFARKAATDA